MVIVNAGAPAGKTDKGTYAGSSRMASPFMGPMWEMTLGNADEGMSTVSIKTEFMVEAEKN